MVCKRNTMWQCITGIIAIMSEQAPLSGMRILVTRPAERSGSFARQIEQAGGEAVLFPVIEIASPIDTTSSDRIIKALASYDIALFISPTAVDKTLDQVPELPASLLIVAIGSSTARAIKNRGYRLAFEAESINSETLLAHARLQATFVRNKRIVIFRGEGGRELLAETLMQRGAQVDYANMYRRALPGVAHIQTSQLEILHAICVTSNQGLEHLMLLCDDQASLKSRPLFVPGSRCEALAQQLGFSEIHTAANATDDAMIASLVHWAKFANT